MPKTRALDCATEIAVLYRVPLALDLGLALHALEINGILRVGLAIVALCVGVCIVSKGARAVGRVTVGEILLKSVFKE